MAASGIGLVSERRCALWAAASFASRNVSAPMDADGCRLWSEDRLKHASDGPNFRSWRAGQADYDARICPISTARTYRPTRQYFWVDAQNAVSRLFQRLHSRMRRIIGSAETRTFLGFLKKRDGATSSSSISRPPGSFLSLRRTS